MARHAADFPPRVTREAERCEPATSTTLGAGGFQPNMEAAGNLRPSTFAQGRPCIDVACLDIELGGHGQQNRAHPLAY
jgi:hypothetical protein